MPTYPSPHGVLRRSVHTYGAIALVLVAGAVFSMNGRARAQVPLWTSPYPLILTPERANALVEASERHLDYVPGEVVVKFKAGMTADNQQRALTSLRSRPAASGLRWAGGLAVLRDESEPDARVLAATLQRQPEVVFAEPNYLYHPTSEPNDPGFASRQWNLKAIDMPRAWDINPGANSDVIVAVIDSGLASATQNFVFPTWNGTSIQTFTARFAVDPDLDPSRIVLPVDFAFWEGPVFDTVGHGTHVAGTVGQDSNNAIGEAGIAYRARIMPVKVCLGYWELQFMRSGSNQPGYVPLNSGGCPGDSMVAGIHYAADNGAKVINMSLGSSIPSQALADALRYAVSKGVFVALAGGNSFEEGNLPDYPATFAADIDGVMSVAALGPSLTRSYFSTTTSRIEIAAPGGNDREGGANAQVWQMTILGSDSNQALLNFPRFDRYADTAYEGTSMAAPHVAGLAALLVSQGITKPAAIEALLKATARDLGASGRDDDTGFGLIQPRAALRGFGVTR